MTAHLHRPPRLPLSSARPCLATGSAPIPDTYTLQRISEAYRPKNTRPIETYVKINFRRSNRMRDNLRLARGSLENRFAIIMEVLAKVKYRIRLCRYRVTRKVLLLISLIFLFSINHGRFPCFLLFCALESLH